MHLEDYSRQISVRLMEAKNEQRAQHHAVSIASLKEITALSSFFCSKRCTASSPVA